MSVLNFLKSGTTKSIPPDDSRCQHHYSNRSRCTKSRADGSEFFCHLHIDTGQLAESVRTSQEREADLIALRAEVMGHAAELDSATAINHVLGNLFRIYLEGRISQTKVAQLASLCRASLATIRLMRDERAEKSWEKCFLNFRDPEPQPSSNADPAHSAESENAPQSAAEFQPDSNAKHQARAAISQSTTAENSPSTQTPHSEKNSERAQRPQGAPRSRPPIPAIPEHTPAAFDALTITDQRNQPNHDSTGPDSANHALPPVPPYDYRKEVWIGPKPDQLILEPNQLSRTNFGRPVWRRNHRQSPN